MKKKGKTSNIFTIVSDNLHISQTNLNIIMQKNYSKIMYILMIHNVKQTNKRKKKEEKYYNLTEFSESIFKMKYKNDIL